MLLNIIMKTIEQIRRENLNLLADMHGGKVGGTKWIADKIDRSPSQVSQWTTGAIRQNGKPSNISASSARRIEEACALQRLWLDVDRGNNLRHEMSSPEPVRSLSDNDAVPMGYHAIPEYEVRLSCGTGNTIDYAETETKSRIYHESFFVNNHAKPENVVRLGAEGNSMKPVIKHGYRVAVHTAAKEIPVVSAADAQDEDNLKIFFLLDDGARKCKYVYIDQATGELVLHSQNTAFKDERYSQEYAADYIVIVGEVIDISGNPNK